MKSRSSLQALGLPGMLTISVFFRLPEAWRLVEKFGPAGIAPEKLKDLCSRMIMERLYGYDERVLDMAAGLVRSEIAFTLDWQMKNLAGQMLPEAADVCARKQYEFEYNINQSHIRSHTPFVTASLTSSFPLII